MTHRHNGRDYPSSDHCPHCWKQSCEVLQEQLNKARAKLAQLSAEAKAAREPLPPEDLIDARHDRVHREHGQARAARTVRYRKFIEDAPCNCYHRVNAFLFKTRPNAPIDKHMPGCWKRNALGEGE